MVDHLLYLVIEGVIKAEVDRDVYLISLYLKRLQEMLVLVMACS